MAVNSLSFLSKIRVSSATELLIASKDKTAATTDQSSGCNSIKTQIATVSGFNSPRLPEAKYQFCGSPFRWSDLDISNSDRTALYRVNTSDFGTIDMEIFDAQNGELVAHLKQQPGLLPSFDLYLPGSDSKIGTVAARWGVHRWNAIFSFFDSGAPEWEISGPKTCKYVNITRTNQSIAHISLSNPEQIQCELFESETPVIAFSVVASLIKLIYLTGPSSIIPNIKEGGHMVSSNISG